jgi:hypothetical protein
VLANFVDQIVGMMCFGFFLLMVFIGLFLGAAVKAIRKSPAAQQMVKDNVDAVIRWTFRAKGKD